MLIEAIPIVTQAVSSSVARPRPHPSPNELRSALRCFSSWLPFMRAESVPFLCHSYRRPVLNRFRISDLTPLIPQLIDILTPPQGSSEFDETEFVAASDALQEIMSKSALSGGSGSRTFTEPLLLWFDRYGGTIIDNTLRGKSSMAYVLDPCPDVDTRGLR